MNNRLFSIPLRGVGTVDVESFASYIHRIAIEHGVYVGELIRHVCNHEAAFFPSGDGEFKPPRHLSPGELVKTNAATLNLVEIFEALTRQSLHPGTLWVLDFIGRSLGEVSLSFKWCPECIAEMESFNEGVYFKLIWQVTAVSHCCIHRTRLVNGCCKCGSSQSEYRKISSMNYCQRCGAKLSKRGDILTCNDVSNSWESDGGDIVELFHDISNITRENIESNGVVKSLNHLFGYYHDRGREGEFYRLLPRNELRSIIRKQKPISLKTTRRIAYRMGVSLYTLMSGNAHQSSAVLNSDWFALCRQHLLLLIIKINVTIM